MKKNHRFISTINIKSPCGGLYRTKKIKRYEPEFKYRTGTAIGFPFTNCPKEKADAA
jgi:hypothetical protein